MRSVRSVSLALAAVALTAPGASAGWDPPEPLAPGTDVFRVFAAPSTGYAIGFASAGSFRIAPRPFGGTLGTVIPLPDQAGLNGGEGMAFDAAGNALIRNHDQRTVTYRGVAGGGGPSQSMGPGLEARAVSMAPTGEAMAALGTTPSGPVKVAFRPAGANTQFDLPGAETFSANGVVVGLQLQANGGAVVVWREGETLKQSVRPAGNPSFDPPTTIADAPGASGTKSTVVFDSRSTGAAMITWYTTPGQDKAYASVRAADGNFGPAQVVGTAGKSLVNVFPAMTSNGDGMAVWTERPSADCLQVTAKGAAYHAGTWLAPVALGPTGGALVNQVSGGPVAGSTDIAVPLQQIEDQGTPCSFGDDRRGLGGCVSREQTRACSSLMLPVSW